MDSRSYFPVGPTASDHYKAVCTLRARNIYVNSFCKQYGGPCCNAYIVTLIQRGEAGLGGLFQCQGRLKVRDREYHKNTGISVTNALQTRSGREDSVIAEHLTVILTKVKATPGQKIGNRCVNVSFS